MLGQHRTKMCIRDRWSILYDNTALTAEAVIRRDWNTKTSYDLVSYVAVTDVG